jgi:hypothetical protein
VMRTAGAKTAPHPYQAPTANRSPATAAALPRCSRCTYACSPQSTLRNTQRVRSARELVVQVQAPASVPLWQRTGHRQRSQPLAAAEGNMVHWTHTQLPPPNGSAPRRAPPHVPVGGSHEATLPGCCCSAGPGPARQLEVMDAKCS